MSPEPRDESSAPRRRRPRVRLLWVLLSVLLLTALAPLWLTAYKLIDINQESLESAIREYQLEVASSIVRELDGALAGAANQLSSAANLLESAASRRRDSEVLSPYLKGDLLVLRYTSGSGSIIEAGDRALARQEALSESLFEAFATSMGGEAFVGRPVTVGPESRPAVVTATPVVVDGQVRGVLAGIVDLGMTWRRSVSSMGEHYITFALDDSGALFAQTGMPEALMKGDEYGALEIVRRFRTQGPGVTEIMPFEAPPVLDVRELLGTRAATRRHWGVFVLVDRNLAYASVAEMRRSVMHWALFAVLLAVVSAIVFAGAITRPLKVLVDRTRRIAAGDFSTRADVTVGNEIGELADTFNFMAAEISSYVDKIKQAAEEKEQLFLGTVKALSAAIDEKDPYTRGHSERVHRYSAAIARHLNLSRQAIREVMIGALLHDVGKIGIEDAVLRKPASLSDKEFEIMKRHPVKGAHILGEIPHLENSVPAARNHHERWTGGGYPDNLKGEEIPLIARIVQVADTFDAMTTNRPYQRAMRFDAAVARITELSGIVFDPRVVAAFKSAWLAGDIKGDESAEKGRPSARIAVPASS